MNRTSCLSANLISGLTHKFPAILLYHTLQCAKCTVFSPSPLPWLSLALLYLFTDEAITNYQNLNQQKLVLTVLSKIKVPRCQQGLAPSGGSRGESSLVSSSFWGLLTFLGLFHSLSPWSHCLLSVKSFLRVSYKDTCHWIWNHPDVQDDLLISRFLSSVKTFSK